MTFLWLKRPLLRKIQLLWCHIFYIFSWRDKWKLVGISLIDLFPNTPRAASKDFVDLVYKVISYQFPSFFSLQVLRIQGPSLSSFKGFLQLIYRYFFFRFVASLLVTLSRNHWLLKSSSGCRHANESMLHISVGFSDMFHYRIPNFDSFFSSKKPSKPCCDGTCNSSDCSIL